MPPTAAQPRAAAMAEIRRGAAEISHVAAQRQPWSAAYRAMQTEMQRSVQQRRDSDGFRLGAHLAIAAWLQDLPSDVGWRGSALARHADLAGWLSLRLGLPPEAVARTVSGAANLSQKQQADVLRLLRAPLVRGSEDQRSRAHGRAAAIGDR